MSRIALFERLAAGGGSRIAVVTPTRRLARAIGNEYDLWRIARGARVWETPTVAPFAAFVALLYERAQHDPALTGIRAPLAAAQQARLWQAVVEASEVPLARPAAAAALAAEAWLLAHQWRVAERIGHYAASDDTRVFANWARAYGQRVEAVGALDPAFQPDAVEALVRAGRLQLFDEIVFVGFDALNPQQAALAEALEVAGARIERWSPGRPRGRVARAPLADTRSEVEAMADWIVARLGAEPNARIGVVVPDLAARRDEIARALDAALEPAAALEEPDRPRPYNISLGWPLARAPLVATALGALELACDELPFPEASALLRARHADFGEASLRERFDAELRRRVGRRVSLSQLLKAAAFDESASRTPRTVLQALERWRTSQGAGRHRHSEWAARIGAGLAAVGFPGASSLDSAEYQVLARWHELLAEFAALDRVVAPVDLIGAVARLRELAGATLFQPEGGDPPVQVLGLLEATGLQFDHLWLMGMTSEAWPPVVHPHPLLPFELQRAARMPGTQPELETARAQSMLEALTHAAGEIVASHALRAEDRPLVASPMIADWPRWTPVPRAARAIDAFVGAPLEWLVDAQAPPVPDSAQLVGGTSVLKDQASCPFRAFATHRLAARALDDPHDGFDAAERGQLIHQVLAGFWQALSPASRAALVALDESTRRSLLQSAAEAAVARVRRRRIGAADEVLASLELRRLVAIGLRWLRYEADERGDFEVIATEERRALVVGPLALRGRLDRVDRVSDGSTIVVDYKTGKQVSASGWTVPRPDEPQLPLYLVATEPDARAVAFARVNAGEPRFVACAEDDGVLPGASEAWRNEFGAWAALVAAWRDELVRLATAFASGRAEVEPKRGVQTCRTCDLAALCRINERADAGAPLHAEEAADD